MENCVCHLEEKARGFTHHIVAMVFYLSNTSESVYNGEYGVNDLPDSGFDTTFSTTATHKLFGIR